MAKSGDVLEMKPLGIRVEFLRTAEKTGGELTEFEVSGRSRGFLAQRHIHPSQVERLEMVEGSMRVGMRGQTQVLEPGDSVEIPAGTPHTQIPEGEGDGRVRIQVRPAGITEAFLERMSDLCRSGQVMRSGFPRPVAGAQLALEFAHAGHASAPPLGVQRGIAKAILGVAGPYVFVDEWDVAAPPDAVFDAIADARSYPAWWRPVYIDVQTDGGPPEVGSESRQHFKGRLPYHLRTRSVITELDPPRRITADVDGDLAGRGTWTLTPTDGGTQVRFDWQVHADRRLLRLLTPVLRPMLRWNHNWAIARAIDGLEPYAQSKAAALTTAS